jgi:hypothetical protein
LMRKEDDGESTCRHDAREVSDRVARSGRSTTTSTRRSTRSRRASWDLKCGGAASSG